MNYFYKDYSKRIFFAIGVVFILFYLILLEFRGSVILNDPFHHGEYFAMEVSLFTNANNSFHPLTIHGALDFIPAFVAKYQWGINDYFLPTFAIYRVLDFISSIFIILIAYEILKHNSYRWAIIIAAATAAPFLAGYKDLFLLLSIFLFFKITTPDVKHGSCIFLQLLFGVTIAFGLFWCYDRGIAAAISLGSAVLVLVFKNKWHAISLASFITTVAVLSLFFDIFSLKNYLNNVSVLMETSGQWGYGWKRWPIVLTVFIILLNTTTVSLIIYESFKSKSLAQNLHIVLFFGLLSIFMVKIGINRADLPHIYSSLWISMLSTIYLYKKNLTIKSSFIILICVILISATILTIYFKSFVFFLVVWLLFFVTMQSKNDATDKALRFFLILLVLCCHSVIFYSSYKSFLNGKYTWIKSISSPASNRSSVTAGLVWVSDRLQDQAVECVFDLSNNGVINGLVKRPSCTRFTYPVYAGPNHEAILISDLRNTLPKAIVYSSTYWSYSIDGRDMKNRFPKLNEYILENYPKEECDYGYCVRFK